MRIRMLAAVAAVAVASALPAGAAPAPQITDPTGDARTQSSGADIVSVLFGTQGTTAKVGKKTVYTPSKLVVTVTYAAAPTVDPYVSHQLVFNAGDCGEVYMEVFFNGTFGSAGCLEDGFDPSVKAVGNALVYTLPFNVIGKQYLKPGALLTDLVAYTAVADPALGYETQEIAAIVLAEAGNPADAAIDYATTTGVYKIA